MRKSLLSVAALLAAALFGVLIVPETASSQRPEDVFVTNFPEVQEVHGEVSVSGTVSHGVADRRREVVVPPVGRHEVGNLVSAGTVDTDGFTSVVLSLEGEVKDTVFAPGQVGVILLPDEEGVLRAMREGGEIQFPLEVTAALRPQESTFFASEPAVRTVGFPRYRVYFYNSGNRSVEANLFLYMTN